MIRYYFSSDDGDVFIDLPSSVSHSTILRIMNDCGFSNCYIYIGTSRYYLDLED